MLDRLVGQFASPYDFLRELVQNAMDAGSDFVEVLLEMHRGDGDDVVFELVLVDAGKGMDEAVVDGELTRLFASSKTDDRTMAGGFGIGFVSVFAWRPDVVLLQTGRTGEAWELVFHPDRRFEKHRLADPVEGTTVRLFRRGMAAERPAIAEAIRDSLWRWCRYCPAEITFEDLEEGSGPELIQDAPLPEDAPVSHEHAHGPTHIRIAFAVPARSVLLRHGLVLAEGPTREVLSELVETLGDSLDHLRVWADSPQLRTSLARDSVVDDEGRAAIAKEIAIQVAGARELLLHKVEDAAARAESWTSDDRARFAHLHAHLGYERAHLGRRLLSRPIVRRASGRPVSLEGLRDAAHAGFVAMVEPDRADASPERDLVVDALRAGIPVLSGEWFEDREWLDPLLKEVGLVGRPLLQVISRVEPEPEPEPELPEIVARLLGTAGMPVDGVRWGTLVDAPYSCLVGVTPASMTGSARAIAVHGGGLRSAYVAGGVLWLNRRHVVLERALQVARTDPRLAVLAVTLAVLEEIGPTMPGPAGVAEALDELALRPGAAQ